MRYSMPLVPRLLTGYLVLSVACAGENGTGRQHSHTAQVKLRLEAALRRFVYFPGEPILATVTLVNTSEAEVTVLPLSAASLKCRINRLTPGSSFSSTRARVHVPGAHLGQLSALVPKGIAVEKCRFELAKLPAGDYVGHVDYETTRSADVVEEVWRGRVSSRALNFSVVEKSDRKGYAFKTHVYAARFLMRKQSAYDKALRHLEEARELDPSSSSVYALIGYCYEYKGDLERAAEAYRKCLKLNPEADAIASHLIMIERGEPLFRPNESSEATR